MLQISSDNVQFSLLKNFFLSDVPYYWVLCLRTHIQWHLWAQQKELCGGPLNTFGAHWSLSSFSLAFTHITDTVTQWWLVRSNVITHNMETKTFDIKNNHISFLTILPISAHWMNTSANSVLPCGAGCPWLDGVTALGSGSRKAPCAFLCWKQLDFIYGPYNPQTHSMRLANQPYCRQK